MIYLCEDDANIRELIVYALSAAGLPTVGFPTPADFREAFARETPELVLLDIMLPGENGLSLLSFVKEEDPALPVLLLTALDSQDDKVRGFDLGADDYITKPFGLPELTARVKTRLRAAGKGDDTLTLGELRVDKQKRTVTVSGEEIGLARKEYDTLLLLLEARGAVLTRDELLSRVWGYSFDGTRTVDVHIRSLRKKLGAAGEMIRTVRGIGYKMKN